MPANEKKYFWIVPLLLAGSGFVFFQFFYQYHLFLEEQIRLFLYTPDFFLTYLNKPAWLSCYVDDFLTQLFYLRGGGAAVLTSLFFIEWLLSSFAIKRIVVIKNAPAWALFPVGMDWILHCDLLHSVSLTIGFITMLLIFLGYASIRNRQLAITFGLFMTLTGYWFAGGIFFLFPLLALGLELKSNGKSKTVWMFVTIAAFLIPLLSRDFYLLTILQSYIYPAIKLQSLLLPLSFVLMLFVAILLNRSEARHQRLFRIAVPIVFIVILAGGIKSIANFTDEKFLSLDNEYYFGNTDRVIELSKKYDLKNRSATYFTNMALAKKGVLPEYLLDFYQPASDGLILPVMPDQSWQSIFVSNEVFFLMGDMNLAQHSAMLGNTFSPYQRSARMIKRLAEINLINGDSAAASKYLRILSKTLFYHKWAASRQTMNHASASNNWLTQKRAQLPASDTLRKSNDYVASLNFLVRQQPNNLVALDYLLCYHLLNKDLNAFRKLYDQYGKSINRPVPSVYSDALLIKLYAAMTSQEELASYALPSKKINDFVAYTQLYEKSKGDLNALKERFGKSYWFYYHFATIQNR